MYLTERQFHLQIQKFVSKLHLNIIRSTGIKVYKKKKRKKKKHNAIRVMYKLIVRNISQILSGRVLNLKILQSIM